MFFSFFKKTALQLAKIGGKKFLAALKKFITDSRLINEIHDRADKDLFLAAANSEEYRHIADIKERNIYDKFIELCFNQHLEGINIEQFVETNYSHKTPEAKNYIKCFFYNLSMIIFEVLKSQVSPDSKIILKGQEIGFSQILTKLAHIENELTKNTNPPTTVITYCANMQNSRWNIQNYEKALTDKQIINTISLSLSNSILNQQNGDTYWESERKSLIYNFSRKVIPLLEDGGSFSVFGLAPIPLLILYGNLFANRPNIDVYQLKKNPSSWEWENNDTKLNISTTWLSNFAHASEAAIMLSFSGKVNIANVNNTIDTTSLPTVELSIENPYDDFLRSKQQLDEFLIEFRKIKAKLLELGVKQIHLFAAIPISFAISIGQAYSPNYDANLVTYDYKQGIYTKALTIGETV